MQYRRIGDLEVSVLGLGTSRLASMGSGRSKDDARRLLAEARECGVNVIDTADTYGSTAAERWIGEITHHQANDWVVVTKTGLPTVDMPGPLRFANQPLKKIRQRVGAGFHVEAGTLRRRIVRSLSRLRRDRIEFYLLHLPPADIVRDARLLDALREAVREGLIGGFGVSSNDLAIVHAARQDWGSICAETAVNPSSQAGSLGADLRDLDLIANHAMGAISPALPEDVLQLRGKTGPRSRLLLRHAAAVPGVKVVLSGTSSVQHLRQNAAALEIPTSSDDLLF